MKSTHSQIAFGVAFVVVVVVVESSLYLWNSTSEQNSQQGNFVLPVARQFFVVFFP